MPVFADQEFWPQGLLRNSALAPDRVDRTTSLLTSTGTTRNDTRPGHADHARDDTPDEPARSCPP